MYSPIALHPSESTATLPSSEKRLRYMVEAYFDFIWRTLRGLGVPASIADDAAQQVFLIASQKLEAIELGSEKAFLFSTARGIAANTRRSIARSREDVDHEALAVYVDHAPNPEQIAEANEARALLERILQSMEEDVREVFVLFELEGMTTAAIATMLKLPMGTVASRLRRAREQFQLAAKRVKEGRS
jgi:RNA polymerase sigma-70 factor (ECF subfamily)